MLGLFLVLPVFALEARHYPGGSDPAHIGLAMGIYGQLNTYVMVRLLVPDCPLDRQAAKQIVRLFLQGAVKRDK